MNTPNSIVFFIFLCTQPRSILWSDCFVQLFSPCFVPTQIFVATIAFLLPSAEHSTVEADKKVHIAQWGDMIWLRSKDPWSVYHVGMVHLQRNVSTEVICCHLFSSHSPLCILSLCSARLFIFSSSFFLYWPHVYFNVSWLNRKINHRFLPLSVNGVTAALPAGLVHGCSPESAARTHYHVFTGAPHISQGPTFGLHLQGRYSQLRGGKSQSFSCNIFAELNLATFFLLIWLVLFCLNINNLCSQIQLQLWRLHPHPATWDCSFN